MQFLDSFSHTPHPVHQISVSSTFQCMQNPSLSLPLSRSQPPSSFTWAAAVTSSHLLPPLPFGLFLTQQLKRPFKTESQIMSFCQNLPAGLQSKSQSPSVTYKALGQPPVPCTAPTHSCSCISALAILLPRHHLTKFLPPSIVYPIMPTPITLLKLQPTAHPLSPAF